MIGRVNGMTTVILSTVKAQCIALLREAQRTGEPILVTRRSRPAAASLTLGHPRP